MGEAFPSEIPLARVMWSLMAVHADLRMEWAAIGGDPTEPVSPEGFFRRMYFFRGGLRSLTSGYTQLHELTRVSREFQQLALRSGHWENFVDQRRAVGRHEQEFDRLRNAFGAHTEESVAEALSAAPASEIVGVGLSVDGHIGCEWAAQAYLAALNHQAGGEEAGAVLRRMAGAQVDFLACFNTALNVYASRYPVFQRP